jgi:hypothetical protein
VPNNTYVADIAASTRDPDTVFAAFNNHKSGDFKPYLAKSTDRGKTWKSIAGDLPDRHILWSVIDDDQRDGLLFAGTEFGLFFTIDGGSRWIELTGGVPTVAFRDLQVQRRETDLVAGTFGRGIFILDDYSPLRLVSETVLAGEATTFPVETALMYIPTRDLGWGDKGTQGDSFFSAPNPPFGAVFTYYLRDELESAHQKRRKAERKLADEGKSVVIPSWNDLRAEDLEDTAEIVLTVEDAAGAPVRRIVGPATAGIHRVAWDLRWPALAPIKGAEPAEDGGSLVSPGTYTVRLQRRVDGELTQLGEPQAFEAVPLGVATLPAPDREALATFHRRAAALQRAVMATVKVVESKRQQIAAMRSAFDATPGLTADAGPRLRRLELGLAEAELALLGDTTVQKRQEPILPSISDRVQRVMRATWTSTSAATTTHSRNYEIASAAFSELLVDLRRLIDEDLAALQQDLEEAGGPWTPGRGLPVWPPAD